MDLLGSCVKFMGSKLSRASTVMGISPQFAQGIFFVTDWNAKRARNLWFGAAMSTPETRNALKLTRKCKYWDAGRCYDGNQCTFAHTSAELRDAPSLLRTQLCYQFRKGQCSRGAACTFAHGKEELRPSSVEVQRSGDPTMGSLGITGRQNEAEDSQMMELLMKMHEVQNLRMQLALQSSHRPLLNEVRDGVFSVSPSLGGNEAFNPSGRSESFWLWTFEARMRGKPDNN